MPASGKSGRHHHGARDVATFRPPTEYGEVFRARADAMGIHYGSYVVYVLCKWEGLALPPYLEEEIRKAGAEIQARNTEQEIDLPLSA